MSEQAVALDVRSESKLNNMEYELPSAAAVPTTLAPLNRVSEWKKCVTLQWKEYSQEQNWLKKKH
jgi:hypothetical protein